MFPIQEIIEFILIFSIIGYAESAPVQGTSANNPTANPAPKFEPSFVPGPPRRGTLMIFFSCLLTLYLCVWTTIHSNIEPKISRSGLHKNKVVWSIVTLLFPEVVLCVAVHERKTAILLCEEMKKAGPANQYVHWDLALAYYAIMGGFVIRVRPDTSNIVQHQQPLDTTTENNTEKKSQGVSGAVPDPQQPKTVWDKNTSYISKAAPLLQNPEISSPNSGQRERQKLRFTLTPHGVLYLAKKGRIPEALNSKMVKDKSKASLLAKFLVCCQAIWTVLQVLSRYAVGVPVTLLELYTVLHTICAVAMNLVWIGKPFNISQPDIIDLDQAVMDDLKKPVDPVEDNGNFVPSPIDVFWSDKTHTYNSHLTRRARLGKLLFRQLWDWDKHQELRGGGFFQKFKILPLVYEALWNGGGFWVEELALTLVGFVYGGLHLAAWDYTFPTNAEQTLWKIASVLTAGSVLGFFSTIIVGFWGRWVWKFWRQTDKKGGPEIVKWLLKLGEVLSAIFILIFCVGFCLAFIPCILARLYLLIESFIAMRKLPVGSYDVVYWSRFLPQLGL